MPNIIHHQLLRESTGGEITAFAMASGAIVRTEAVNTERCTGFAALNLVVAGTITVAQQVSVDETTWLDPVDTFDLSLASIGTSISANKYISYDPVLAHYTRFVFTANSTSTISASFLQGEA